MVFDNVLIMVGKAFQAEIPTLIPNEMKNVVAGDDRSLCVWKPSDKLEDTDIETFVNIAWKKFGLPEEQALTILYFSQNDLGKAVEDLDTYYYTVKPEHGTSMLSEGEQVLFQEGICRYGKDFSQIHQMIQGKSMCSLIQHYYLQWKPEQKWITSMYHKVKSETVAANNNLNGSKMQWGCTVVTLEVLG